ncbi:type VI secretion system membrane subunit TssM [Mesorhizobium sp. 1B3]|uniref:type VI secretion system membrane subunit TssM n=1 Tax=Mesorhizobium sp. 1B3 TaxID=3243599 RepID=UPI003D96C110
MTLKSTLRRFGRVLARPAVYLTILIVLLALAIWFLGPLLGTGEWRPLGSVPVRLVLLLLLALSWGIGGVLMRARRSSDEQALLAALRRREEEKDVAADREAQSVEQRFQQFRAAARDVRRFLGRSRRPGSGAAAMPWYIVLGATGTGKSTLCRSVRPSVVNDNDTNADDTATAQFHLLDEAVLVELDGAFLQQEEGWPRQLWPRILDQLRGFRPRQPLNGVVLTIGVDDLLQAQPEALIDLAVAARRRMEEIGTRLRTRAPLYIVVTKLDLLLGFEEFFESLPAEEREAALGFPLAALDRPPADSAGSAFSAGFADLLQPICGQLTMRLHEEPDELRRRRINELPSQFALLKPKLLPLVQQLTSTGRFAVPPLVRGLFFVSASQTNDFVDISASALGQDFAYGGEGLRAAPQSIAIRSRPYFVAGLLQKVMLPERGLAGLTRPGRVIMQMRDIGANVALAMAAVFFITVWWLAFSEGRAYVGRLDQGTSEARQSIQHAAPERAMPAGFGPVLEILDHLRNLAQERPKHTTAGLYNTSGAEAAGESVYDSALADMVLPFLWSYLRNGLGASGTPEALRLQQLKLYLMIGGERPVDAQTARLVAADFTSHWLPNDRSAEVEQAVAAHLAEFSRLQVTAPPIDLVLVERARGRISDYTLARIAYDLALAMPAVTARPAWRPVEHMGLAGPQALSRISGKSFWDGIPGIYTADGLKKTMLPASREAAGRVAADLWALGMADTSAEREREERRIRDGLLDLYRVDYITVWESLLSDLDIAQANTAGDLARAMALTIGQPSPIKELTVGIAQETNPAEAAPPALDAVAGAAGSLQPGELSVLTPHRVIDVASAVSDHFPPFRKAVVADEGQQAQIDALLAAMEPLYRQINHVAIGGDVLELGTEPQTLLADLTQRVAALPENLQPLFRRILNKAAAVTAGKSRQRLADIWTTTVLPLCLATTAGRYPFEPGSSRDAAIADFASLFGPKGAIASFRNDYLRPFIDSNAKPWRWRSGQQFGLDLDDSVLRQFELADEITTAYFGESEKPLVAFEVEPIGLDRRARAFQLDIGGPTLIYAHGPPSASVFSWPPENPAAEAMLSMTPEMDGERNMLRFQGAWALFRLFDAGHILEAKTTDVVPYQFDIGSRSLRLFVTAPPTRNPFSRDILSNFSCPELR